MVFPTLNFLLFYVAVWTVSWGLITLRRHTLHKLALIAASYVFYALWSWRLAFLLAFNAGLNWAFGLAIEAARGRRWQGAVTGLGVACNLAVLGFFKYYIWFAEELNALLTKFDMGRELPLMEIILPIGISFFTFQGISYIVDLHRGQLDRARGLIDVTFFLSFFPHLVAGPIVRAASFLPQLETPPDPRRVFVGLGVMLVIWGVFKKAVIANWLAIGIVDPVFQDPAAYGAADVAAAVYGYAVQIYCDFSAYSDIAIGIAALLGYRFQRNFNQPYRAAGIADFWRRWHMSLSSWLRDYLYIPLGGSRGGPWRTYRNLMLTMVLGGIWHGAAWKFVAWGALHGGALALERAVVGAGANVAAPREASRFSWRRALAIFATFHFVCLCWILFRAKSLEQAQEVIAGLARWSDPVQLLTPFLAGLIALGLLTQAVPAGLIERLDRVFQKLPVIAAGVLAGLALLLIEAIGGDGSAPFIYFQF